MLRPFAYLSPIFFLLIFFTACSNKQRQTSPSPHVEEQSQTSSSLVEMPALENQYTDRLNGHEYLVTISRQPDETLPKSIDELGNEYSDNRVDVVITKDGQDFFSRTYSKNSFLNMLSESESLGTVLLGMAYDSQKSNEKILCLAAQIGQIGIEEGPAFTIEIPLAGGTPNIQRDMEQDTSGSQDSDL